MAATAWIFRPFGLEADSNQVDNEELTTTNPKDFFPVNKETLKHARQSARQRRAKDSVHNELLNVKYNPVHPEYEEIRAIDYKKYSYDFENIVFEGGGAKGAVYVGALEVSVGGGNCDLNMTKPNNSRSDTESDVTCFIYFLTDLCGLSELTIELKIIIFL